MRDNTEQVRKLGKRIGWETKSAEVKRQRCLVRFDAVDSGVAVEVHQVLVVLRLQSVVLFAETEDVQLEEVGAALVRCDTVFDVVDTVVVGEAAEVDH